MAQTRVAAAAQAQSDVPAVQMIGVGKWYGEFDFKFNKKFPLKGKATAEFSAEVFNALYADNFNQNLNPGTGSNIFRITSGGSGARTGQLVWRVSW